MMREQEMALLKARRATMERWLSECSADEILLIDQYEFEVNRLTEQIKELAVLEPKRAAVTFDGQPVEGSSAAEIGFMSKIMALFSKAVSDLRDTLRADGLSEPPLLFTGAAKGSFGFEVEVQPPVGETEDTDPFPAAEEWPRKNFTAQALETLERILEAAGNGADDAVATMADLSPKATESLNKLFAGVAESNAGMGIAFTGAKVGGGNAMVLGEIKEVLSIEAKVSEEWLDGHFDGVLSIPRTFQFVPDVGKRFTGKMSARTGDLDGIHWTGRRARILVRKTTRRRTHHTVMEYELSDSPGPLFDGIPPAEDPPEDD